VFEVGASPGRPPKLSAKEKERLVHWLLQGALAHGYSTELWTCDRIATLIRKEFRVHYHRDHVGRLMRQLGWSYQKPERRALERNEKAIEHWKRREWPRVKKTLHGWMPASSSSTSRASS
jgi:transposase